MVYRMRVYEPAEDAETATRLFDRYVRPVHEELGAELIGRWCTEEGRTVVIWAYQSREDWERIQIGAAGDPRILGSAAERDASGLARVERVEWFMSSTVEPQAG